jgi:malic enzyme
MNPAQEEQGVQFKAMGRVEVFRVTGDPKSPVSATLVLTCSAPYVPGGVVRYMCTFINRNMVAELAAANGRKALEGRTATLQGLPVPSIVSNAWVDVIRAQVTLTPQA